MTSAFARSMELTTVGVEHGEWVDAPLLTEERVPGDSEVAGVVHDAVRPRAS
jgi:hypothetical protein